MSSINSVRKLQILYFSMKRKEIKNLKNDEKSGPISAFIHTPNNPKNENIEKMKKHLEISSFYTCVPKLMIIGYTILEIWQVTNVIVVFHFGQFFFFFELGVTHARLNSTYEAWSYTKRSTKKITGY